MPRFSANLSMLFTELPFVDRFGAAARAQFKAVECQFPYDHPKEALAEQLAQHGLVHVLHNLPAGDWAGGERGIAVLPDRVDEFRSGVALAIDYAQALGCQQLNCLAGVVPPNLELATAHHTLVENLRYAAHELGAAGLRLLIEPINTYDVPGFFLNRTAQALELIDAVGAPNLLVQYDIYHAQRMEGELANTLGLHRDRIGHIQLADNPGRHEPGTGEINFAWLLAHIDRLGYDGWIGCEYKPRGGTLAGLGWMHGLNS